MRKILLAAIAALSLTPTLASAHSYSMGGGYGGYGGYRSYAAPRVYMAPRPYYRPRIIVPIVPIIPIVPLDPCPYDYVYSNIYDRCVPIY